MLLSAHLFEERNVKHLQAVKRSLMQYREKGTGARAPSCRERKREGTRGRDLLSVYSTPGVADLLSH